MPSQVCSAAVNDIDAYPVKVEVNEGFSGRSLQNGPPVLAHIQDSDDLNAVWKNPITNQGLPHHDAPQIWKDGRLDPVSTPGVFPDCETRRLHLSGHSHFHPMSQLTPEIPADVPPVFPGNFCESNPQSSSGSVKNSGGQSSSLAPFASLNFCSKAGVAR